MATLPGNLTKINNLQPHTFALVRLAFDPTLSRWMNLKRNSS